MENMEIEKKSGGLVRIVVPVIGAVIVVAVAVAYICVKLANMRYNEKWKDYDECGWH